MLIQVADKTEECRRTQFFNRLQIGRNADVRNALLAAVSLLDGNPSLGQSFPPLSATAPSVRHDSARPPASRAPSPAPALPSTEPVTPAAAQASTATDSKGDFVELLENGRKVTVHAELASKLARQKHLETERTAHYDYATDEHGSMETSEGGLREGGHHLVGMEAGGGYTN